MILSIAVFEVLVWIKFSQGILFTDSPPAEVFFPILAFAALFTLWMVLFFTQRPTARRGGKSPTSQVTKWAKLDVLFWVSFLPLLMLTTQWAY